MEDIYSNKRNKKKDKKKNNKSHPYKKGGRFRCVNINFEK
jgi:hypothetical protein